MPRPKKYPDEQTLEKAMFIFWKKGYSETSIKDLESVLNLTASSIYNTYGSKENLFIKAIEHYIDSVVNLRIQQHLKQDDSPIQNIQNFFLSLVDDPQAVKSKLGCMLTNTSTQLDCVTSRVSTKIQKGMEEIKKAFYIELMQASKNDQLDSRQEPHELATALFLGYQGLLVMFRLNYTAKELRHAALSVLQILDN